MPVHRSLYPVLVALVAAAPIPAQLPPPGTIAFRVHGKLPDSPNLPVPIGSGIDVQVTLMFDGQRIAADIVTGTGTLMPILAGMRLHAVYAVGSDTLHAGILFPLQTAAAMGGVPGFRFDLPMSALDSARRSFGHAVDSIARKRSDSLHNVAAHTAYRSLGANDTVAGITCEKWEMTTATDTTQICVIPTPPAMLALEERIRHMVGVEQWLDQMPGLAATVKEAFGGRQMTSIRTENIRTGMRMELVSYQSATPAPGQFELPPNLQPLPWGMGIKPPGGERALDRR